MIFDVSHADLCEQETIVFFIADLTEIFFLFLDFAGKILGDFGGPRPRVGKKSDEAHPPIHPLKSGNNLNGESVFRIWWPEKVKET